MSASERSHLISQFRKSKLASSLNQFGGETITEKQDAWVKEVKATGDLKASTLKVYDITNPSSTGNIIKHNMSKPSIRAEVEECMEGAGLQTINVMKAVGDALLAVKPGTYDEDGNYMEGEPDHRMRLDAAKEAFKLKNAYPKEEPDKHLHLHAHMVEEFSSLPFEEITSMMKAEVITAESVDQGAEP